MKAIIAGMPGLVGLTLSRCLERPAIYLLLVQCGNGSRTTVGFRASDKYQDWRQLLQHFYDPFPVVEHYEQVHDAQGPSGFVEAVAGCRRRTCCRAG